MHFVKFIVCLIILIVCMIISGTTGVHYFNSTFVCHCDLGCATNGSCMNADDCSDGWMGPKCQYVNIAEGMNVSTVGHVLHMDLKRAYWVSWVQIQSSQPGISIADIKVTLSAENHWSKCESPYSRKENSNHNIFCQKPLLSTAIKIEWKTTLIPKILISGGMNVAVKQDTNQTTTYKNYKSSMAVDGNTIRHFDNGTCTHTAPGHKDGDATWILTLSRVYNTRFFRIYNRYSNIGRLDGFSLSISSGSESKIKHIDTDIPPNRTNIVVLDIVPDKLYTVQTINISLPGTYENILSLCEVQVFVDCVDGRFNFDCSHDCNCYDSSEVCQKVFGICVAGCAAGYEGDNCLSRCDNNHYGSGCDHECSSNCKVQTYGNRKCFITDGRCLNGCILGSVTPTCVVILQSRRMIQLVAISVSLIVAVVGICVVTITVVVRRKMPAQTLDTKVEYSRPPSFDACKIMSVGAV